MTASVMDKDARRELNRANRNRRFPVNTCPASRHVQIIGECLAKGGRYHMIEEEPEHVAASLLSTVASLYKARTKIERLKKKTTKKGPRARRGPKC